MKPMMRQPRKHGWSPALGWIASIVLALLVVTAQHFLAPRTGPPWEIPCMFSLLTLVLLEFDALAFEVQVRIPAEGEQASARAAKADLGERFFRVWPSLLLPAAAMSSAFFITVGLRWGLGGMGYCALPLCVSFSAMLGAHISLIRRLRRLLAVRTGSGTSPLDAGQRRRLRLYYGVICLVAFSGFALLLVTSRPWRLKAMIRSGAVLSSFGIILSLLAYRGGRKALQAKVDDKGAQSVCP